MPGTSPGTATSVPVTLILLLVVFGSLIAAGIPVLLAITAVIGAISLLSVIRQWLPVGQGTSEVVLVIGMAVGVDYSLFYLRREREERARGRSSRDALRIAAGTSGQAIVISGLTVMIAPRRAGPARRPRLVGPGLAPPDRETPGFQRELTRRRRSRGERIMKRPNSAPAYYQGRPASLWLNVMTPCRRRAAGCPGPWPPRERPLFTDHAGRRQMTKQAEDIAAALTGAASRTARLLRGGLDPAARVPGLTWNAAETAAHLAADLHEHTAILTGTYHASGTADGRGDGRNPAERGAAANRAQLGAFPERDLAVLAGLIEEAAAEFGAALADQPGRGPVVTANGVPMSPATLASVLLGEQLIHGLDLARSARRPWPIARGDALRVIPGMMAVAGDYLDRDAAHGLHVSYELRFGAGDRYRFAVDGATATAGPAEGLHDRPDCVITADPVAFLLVGYGRAGQWSQILRGKLRAGGRRPWLALRFSSLLTRP